LATFVIGLADATIINVFDKTPGDLDKSYTANSTPCSYLNDLVKMSPSYQFVHQNFSHTLAASKGLVGRQKFQVKLDEIHKLRKLYWAV